jgi:hypothetical protein
VETRLAKLHNPAMGDKGYGILFNHYWDVPLDYMRYSVHDAHETRQWSEQDRNVFFNPNVLPRVWFFAPLLKRQITKLQGKLWKLRLAKRKLQNQQHNGNEKKNYKDFEYIFPEATN